MITNFLVIIIWHSRLKHHDPLVGVDIWTAAYLAGAAGRALCFDSERRTLILGCPRKKDMIKAVLHLTPYQNVS